MISFTCVCCEFTQEFANAQAADNAGWDVPPFFTGYVSCNLCPASFIVTGQIAKHASVHERWEREGRPAEWSQQTCLDPKDRIPETELDRLRKMLEP